MGEGDTQGRALEEDPSPEYRARAAWALGEIGDPIANAAMRRALATTTDAKTIVEVLMKTGGFTSAEIVTAVEAYMTGGYDTVLRSSGLRKIAARQIALLRTRGRARSAVAAAIAGDPAEQRKLLEGNDVEAISVLIALARILGDELPVALVRDLPRRHPATAKVVKAYLDAAAVR